jgi:hypothetical protein
VCTEFWYFDVNPSFIELSCVIQTIQR